VRPGCRWQSMLRQVGLERGAPQPIRRGIRHVRDKSDKSPCCCARTTWRSDRRWEPVVRPQGRDRGDNKVIARPGCEQGQDDRQPVAHVLLELLQRLVIKSQHRRVQSEHGLLATARSLAGFSSATTTRKNSGIEPPLDDDRASPCWHVSFSSRARGAGVCLEFKRCQELQQYGVENGRRFQHGHVRGAWNDPNPAVAMPAAICCCPAQRRHQILIATVSSVGHTMCA